MGHKTFPVMSLDFPEQVHSKDVQAYFDIYSHQGKGRHQIYERSNRNCIYIAKISQLLM